MSHPATDGRVARADVGRRRTHAGRPTRQAPRDERATGDGDRAGLEALRLALHEPATTLPRLSPVLFGDPVQRRAFEAIAPQPDHSAVIDALEATGDRDAADLVRRLLVEEPAVPPPGTDAVAAVVAQLVRHATRRVLREREVAVRAGDLAARDVVEEITVAKELVDRLEGPTGEDAERELVEWLAAEGVPHAVG